MNWREGFGILGLLGSFTILAGCGSWPPVLDCEEEVKAVRKDVQEVRVRGLEDGEVATLERLSNLERLDFGSGHAVGEAMISDRGLKTLAGLSLPRLKILSLGYCDGITDRGLNHVAEMKSVTWLSLMACRGVTDEGIGNLAPMDNLKGLDLRGCPRVTDSGLVHLAQMDHLRQIWLGGCDRVSMGGVKKLQKALPECLVIKDDLEWSYHQR